MNDKKAQNIQKAKLAWEIYLSKEEISMADIAKKVGIKNRSEISNIIKYTTAQMYLDTFEFKNFEDELFGLRKFTKEATFINRSQQKTIDGLRNKIDILEEENSLLEEELEFERLPWWEKIWLRVWQ